ncbi:hypothetical protein MMC28_007675 [Mycoblastus sanguinarius]|nr:hypothetical protein [Mycoblastus sanguinarius]
MHYLKVTALATALAVLASTSPVPDRAIVERGDGLNPDVINVCRRDRAVVERAESLDLDYTVYRKEERAVYSKYENNRPYNSTCP